MSLTFCGRSVTSRFCMAGVGDAAGGETLVVAVVFSFALSLEAQPARESAAIIITSGSRVRFINFPPKRSLESGVWSLGVGGQKQFLAFDSRLRDSRLQTLLTLSVGARQYWFSSAARRRSSQCWRRTLRCISDDPPVCNPG